MLDGIAAKARERASSARHKEASLRIDSLESSLRDLRHLSEEDEEALQEVEERRVREERTETLRAQLREVEQGAGPRSSKSQSSLDKYLTPTQRERAPQVEQAPFEAFAGERGPKHPCTLSVREQRLLEQKKAREKKVKELEQELENERARQRETGLQAAREQLEAVKGQCSTITLKDAPRKQGRPRKSEAEKARLAPLLRRGLRLRQDMPTAEAQLRIREQVLAEAKTPDAASKRSSSFWSDTASEFGLSPSMLKRICSDQQGVRAKAYVAAKKAKPDSRGRRRHWKRFESRGQGRRQGVIKAASGKLKTKPARFDHLWERVKVWGKRQAANAREFESADAADQFVEELEQELWCLEVKRPDTTKEDEGRIQLMRAKKETLEKQHNWRSLVAQARYELQIVDKSQGT